MPDLLEEFGRSGWEFSWAYTGSREAATACLARFFQAAEAARIPEEEPARRRFLWRALADACRQQVSLEPPRPEPSGDARLAAVLSLPLELREALLLLRFHGASAEDLGVILGCPPPMALGRVTRALTRLALGRAMPS